MKEKKEQIDTNSSFSFLELPFEHKNITTNEKYVQKYRDSIDKVINIADSIHLYEDNLLDPLYENIEVKMPKKMIKFVSARIKCEFVDEDKLIVMENGVVKFVYDVFDFKNILDMPIEFKSRIVIVLNRKKVAQMFKKINNKNYKECVENKTEYKPDFRYKECVEVMMRYQIRNKLSYVYVDCAEDFGTVAKTLLCPDVEREYVPKVKTFLDNKNNDYFVHCLCLIPGISKFVARHIIAKYPNLTEVIQNCKNENISQMDIFDENGKLIRKIGKKQSDLILKYFCG